MFWTKLREKYLESCLHVSRFKHLRRQSPRPLTIGLTPPSFQGIFVRSFPIKVIKTQADFARPCFPIQTTEEDHHPLKIWLWWHVQVKLQIPKRKSSTNSLPQRRTKVLIHLSQQKIVKGANQHLLVPAVQQVVKLHEMPLLGQWFEGKHPLRPRPTFLLTQPFSHGLRTLGRSQLHSRTIMILTYIPRKSYSVIIYNTTFYFKANGSTKPCY